jgi:hypothetical protein
MRFSPSRGRVSTLASTGTLFESMLIAHPDTGTHVRPAVLMSSVCRKSLASFATRRTIQRLVLEERGAHRHDNVQSSRGGSQCPQQANRFAWALKARNKEFPEQGAPNKDSAMQTLLTVTRAFAHDKPFLAETLSADALDALTKLVSEQARRGHLQLGPAQWGQFLEYVTERRWR